MKPLVSVIVPVYNDSARLVSLLEALEAQTLPQSQFEVMVVDNNSEEDIPGVVERFPGVDYCFEERPGSYAARNAALPRARAAVLAFTDSDCLPKPDWLEQGLLALRNQADVDALAGPIQVFPVNEPPTLAEQLEMVFAFPQETFVRELHYGATANVFARQRAFAKAGPFDATLKSNGDQEWGKRLHDSGGQWTYAPGVIVKHPARSWPEIEKKIWRVAGGKVATRRHQPGFNRYLLVKTLWRALPQPAAYRQIFCSKLGLSLFQKLRLCAYHYRFRHVEMRALLASVKSTTEAPR